MKHPKSGPKYRTFKPSHAADVLGPTLDRLRLSKKLDRYEGFAFWPEVVGEKIAKVSVPEKIMRNNVLVVRVLDAAWAQELSMLKTEFLEKIQQLNVGAIIEDIRFITGDPKSFDTEKNS